MTGKLKNNAMERTDPLRLFICTFLILASSCQQVPKRYYEEVIVQNTRGDFETLTFQIRDEQDSLHVDNMTGLIKYDYFDNRQIYVRSFRPVRIYSVPDTPAHQ